MSCRGINRKYPLAGDGSWKIWRSYSALEEYGLWKNLKFSEAAFALIKLLVEMDVFKFQNIIAANLVTKTCRRKQRRAEPEL